MNLIPGRAGLGQTDRMRPCSLLACFVAIIGCTNDAPRPTAAPSASAAERWVSLSPGITETIAALGGAASLVAVSDYCARPAAVCTKPRVGHALRPDLEAIAALRPDLIVYEQTQQGPGTDLSRLARVEVLPWLSLEEITGSIERLGQRLGRTDAADALLRRMRAVLGRAPNPAGPEVLMLLGYSQGSGTFWFVKPESLHGHLVPAAGGRPPAAVVGWSGPPKLTAEDLVRIDPEWIVVLSQGDEDGRLDTIRRLSPLRAVKQDRLRRLTGPGVLSTGPTLVDYVAPLAAALKESPSP